MTSSHSKLCACVCVCKRERPMGKKERVGWVKRESELSGLKIFQILKNRQKSTILNTSIKKNNKFQKIIKNQQIINIFFLFSLTLIVDIHEK